MKSIFRSIRMKLIGEGRVGRYFTYAIGEVILIIVGILIALQISEWNVDRKAQKEFDEYIVQLKVDVTSAIRRAERRAEAAKNRVKEAVTVLKFLESPPVKQGDLEAFETALDGVGRFAFTDLDFGRLGQILNGNLDSLNRDRELSREVLSSTGKLGSDFRIMKATVEYFETIKTTFGKYRGLSHHFAPDMAMSYDFDKLASSEEFKYAVQNTIEALGSASERYAEIAEGLQGLLVILEEYEGKDDPTSPEGYEGQEAEG